MNRLEFMNRLELLLNDISENERQEALQYYNDYLNDAGVENEEEVLLTLGTPEELAKVIKEGLEDNSDAGEFSENGYRNASYEAGEKAEVITRETEERQKGQQKQESQQKQGGQEKQGKPEKKEKERMSGGMIAVIVILCIFAAPLLLAVAAGLLGAGLGVFGAILGTMFGIAVGGIALVAAAGLLIVIGIGELFTLPLAGACMIGAGMLLGGLALFFIWLTVWICAVAVPWMVRGIVKITNRLFHKSANKEGEENG